MVRSEERAIYTHSRNLTVQIYVESPDVDLRTSDLNRKHCSHRVKVCTSKSMSELPTNVGTSDGRSQPASKTPGVATPDLGRDVRLSGVPTHVGTSDGHGHRAG